MRVRRRLAARLSVLLASVLVLTELSVLPAAADPGGMEGGGSDAECPAEIRLDPEPAAADEAEALTLAELCGREIEVESGRGYAQRTFALPTGAVRSDIYLMPHWTQNESGEWVDVDTTLVVQPNGSVRAKATIGEVRFSGGGVGPFAELIDPEGHRLALTWDAPLPAPIIDGNVATYEDVLPDVDLQVTADVDGFSYLFVVHTAAAAADPALSRLEVGITGSGVQFTQEADGRVVALDSEGEFVFGSGTAAMWDSSMSLAYNRLPDPGLEPPGPDPEGATLDSGNGLLSAGDEDDDIEVEDDPHDGTPPADEAAALGHFGGVPGHLEPIDLELDGQRLAILPDTAMLTRPDLTFPLIIDPDFYGKSRTHWATVHREQPGKGWTNDSAWPRQGGIRMGLCDFSDCLSAWGLWRGVMRFDTKPLRGRYIHSAKVKMTQTHTGGCGSYNVQLWKVDTITNGVTWNGVKWRSHGSNGYLQRVSVASSNKTGCGTSNPNRTITFSNSAVRNRIREVADANESSVSFGVRSNNEGTWTQWRRVSSSSLKLEVDHSSYPQTPTNLSTAGKGCATSSPGPWLTTGRPALSGTPRNADGTGRYQLAVRRTGSSTDTYTFRSGVVTVNTSRTHTVSSAGTLADGSYRWRMRTESAASGVPASSYSSWCYFRVDTTPPPAPSATLLTEHPALGQTVQVRLSGSSDTHRFRYSLNGGPTTTATASGGQLTISVTPPTTSIDHVLQVWALDEAGNLSARHDLWFTVGKLAPTPVAGVWRLDGDLRDDSGNGHKLVDVSAGFTSGGGADRLGRAGSAAVLDGQSCARTAGPVVNSDESFTVAAWARPDDGGGTAVTIASQGGTTDTAFRLHRWSSNRWAFVMVGNDAGDGEWHTALSPGVATGGWQHVAGVHDAAAGQMRLYVDGVLVDTVAAPPAMWRSSQPFFIGCAGASALPGWDPFDGAIDEVVVYQAALTEAEIGQLMAGSVPAGEVSWWPMRGDGHDAGPAGEDLTVPAGTAWVADSHGRTESALQFDGTSCASTAGPVLRTDSSFTVSAWVYLTDGGAAGTNPTVISQAGSQRSAFHLAWHRSSNRWQFTMPSADAPLVAWSSVYSLEPAQLERWTHLTGVYRADLNEMSLYVDGVLQETAPAHTPMWHAAGPVRIGCATRDAGQISDYVTGAVHDVRLWRGAATPEMVQAVALQGLAYWELDEFVGGQDAWGGNHLTFVGEHDWVEDRFGDCFAAYGLVFEGSGYARTDGPVLRADESFTVSAWAKIDDTSADRTVLAQAGTVRSSLALEYHAASNRWRFVMPSADASSVTWHVASSTSAPQVGVWYHLTAAYDLGTGQMRLYVDGELQQTVAGPASPWHTDGRMLIGAGGDTAGAIWNPLVGAVDQVRVYAGVLDPLRIGDQAATRPGVQLPPGLCDW